MPKRTYGPLALVGVAAYAGVLQAANAPGVGTGRRRPTASALAPRWPGPESTALWLSVWTRRCIRTRDTFDRRGTGFWRRSGHALRGTILTRTDSGGETLSTWRIGSAYGSAFLSNHVVSGPAQYGAPRVHPGFGNTRVRSGRQSGIGVLAGYQEKGAAQKMTTHAQGSVYACGRAWRCWFSSRVQTPIRTRC